MFAGLRPANAANDGEPLAILAGISVIMLGIGTWTWIVVLIKKGPRALFGRIEVAVNAFENVVVYRNGQFEKALPPGTHWIRGKNVTLVRMDIRPEVLQIQQGVVTADRTAAVLRCLVQIQINDPRIAIEAARDYRQQVFADLQSMIKRLGYQWTLRDLYTNQDEFGSEAQTLASQITSRLGVACLRFELLTTEPSSELPAFEKRDVGFRPN